MKREQVGPSKVVLQKLASLGVRVKEDSLSVHDRVDRAQEFLSHGEWLNAAREFEEAVKQAAATGTPSELEEQNQQLLTQLAWVCGALVALREQLRSQQDD